MADCDKYLDMISAGVDGELSREEDADLHAHLETCSQCRQVYDAFQCIGEAVRDDMAEPPELLCPGVMRKIRSMERGDSPRRFAFGKFTALAACLAVVIFAAGQFGLFGGNESQTDADSSLRSSADTGIAEYSSNDSLSVPEVDLEGIYDGSDMAAPESNEAALCTLGESMALATSPEEGRFAVISSPGLDVSEALALPLEQLDRLFSSDVEKITVFSGGDVSVSPLFDTDKAEVITRLSEELAIRLEVSLDDVPEEKPLYTFAYTLGGQEMLARAYRIGNHVYCLVIPRELAEAQDRARDSGVSDFSAEAPVPRTETVEGEQVYRHIFYLANGDPTDFEELLSGLVPKK